VCRWLLQAHDVHGRHDIPLDATSFSIKMIGVRPHHRDPAAQLLTERGPHSRPVAAIAKHPGSSLRARGTLPVSATPCTGIYRTRVVPPQRSLDRNYSRYAGSRCQDSPAGRSPLASAVARKSEDPNPASKRERTVHGSISSFHM